MNGQISKIGILPNVVKIEVIGCAENKKEVLNEKPISLFDTNRESTRDRQVL